MVKLVEFKTRYDRSKSVYINPFVVVAVTTNGNGHTVIHSNVPGPAGSLPLEWVVDGTVIEAVGKLVDELTA